MSRRSRLFLIGKTAATLALTVGAALQGCGFEWIVSQRRAWS